MLQLLKRDHFNYDPGYEENITGIEILNYTKELRNIYITQQKQKQLEKLIFAMTKGNRHALIANVCHLNSCIKKNGIKKHICHSGKKNAYMKNAITNLLMSYNDHSALITDIQSKYSGCNSILYQEIIKEINTIQNKWKTISTTMKKIESMWRPIF